MPTKILMPALTPTMEEGALAKWLVSEGDAIRAGDVIAEIETDKAIMVIESIDDGVMGEILVQEGSEGVKVNTPIAIVLSEGLAVDTTAISQPDAHHEAGLTAQDGDRAGMAATAVGDKVESDAFGPRPGGVLEPDPDSMIQTVRDALRDAMAEEMRRDGDVFVMGEEVAEYQGAYKVTQGLLDEFGSARVIDTPITEHGFTGIGVGAAFAGLKPIIEFMTWNFAMQAIDHIINSAAKTLYMSGGQMGCSIVFRGPNGAAARVGAQHSQCFAAWYTHVPGLKVVAPFSAADAKGLLKAAIRDPNPVVFLEHEILYGQSFDVPRADDWIVPIGKASVVREGSDVTIVSFSRGMIYALDAAEALEADNVSAEVIDLRTLRPLDMATIIESVKKTNRIVTVEESWPVCSVGTEICACVTQQAFDYLDAPPIQVAGADVPMPYAANLEALALPTSKQVAEAAKSVCYAN